MKERSGLVSNSSSSSFIVLIDKTKKCSKCKMGTAELLWTLLKDSSDYTCSDQTGINAQGYDEIIDDLSDSGWSDDYIAEIKDKLKDYTNYCYPEDTIDKVLAHIQISYHDVTVNKLFKIAREDGSITVIYDFCE